MRWRVRNCCWITFWSRSVDFWDLKIKKTLRSTASGISTRFTLTIFHWISIHTFIFVMLPQQHISSTNTKSRTHRNEHFSILILIFAMIIVRGLLRASSRTFNHYRVASAEMHFSQRFVIYFRDYHARKSIAILNPIWLNLLRLYSDAISIYLFCCMNALDPLVNGDWM